MSSTMNTLTRWNNRLIEDLENPIIKYGFLIIVVIKIMAIDYIPTEYLELYDNITVKVIYAFLIAYFACFDPIYSIVLTTLIIISLQELYSRRANIKGNYIPVSQQEESELRKCPKPFITAEEQENHMSHQSVRYENNTIPSTEYLVNDENIFAEINKHSLQKIPSSNDKLIAEYDYYEDPAFRTITANLKDREIFGKNDFYVTGNDLNSSQTNNLRNSKMSSSVQAFEGSINNIQGLPNGYDPARK